MMDLGSFHLQAVCGKARVGELVTAHGVLNTPVFMPVGTQASVKAMLSEELEGLGVQVILANTYHLHLRPGEKIIKQLGGLHQFMNWKGILLTDSGGFQVFSLSQLNKISEEGVEFQSHLDGSRYFISPEKSMEIQIDLGSDIIMAFDECPPHSVGKNKVKEAVDKTYRWLLRCEKVVRPKQTLLFGIVQGGLDLDLRMKSLEKTLSVNLPGYALGGFSVGEPIESMHELVSKIAPYLPENKPRYLMGVGTPCDLVRSVDQGMDMFDCVLPTRLARMGSFFTWSGRVKIKNTQYKDDPRPLDPQCACFTCQNYSRAYLRHTFLSGEIVGFRLGTLHNLYFYMNLMEQIRNSINKDTWDDFKQHCLTQLA